MTPTFPFAFWTSSADLLSGADGALSLNGTTAYIDAGDIKRYSSISIINSGQLVIRGYSYYGTANPGHLPTLIGCQGNCTINTAGQIIAQDNIGPATYFYGDKNIPASTVPFDAAIASIAYDRMGGYGGNGGETGGYGTIPGYDTGYGPDGAPTGHGGGGAGANDGSVCSDGFDWGVSGTGADSTTQTAPSGMVAIIDGFSVNGADGLGGEVGSGVSVGGGGGGGTRAYSGGAVFLQIGGVATIDTGSIALMGSDGGQGGMGGQSDSPDDASYAGGGGGGGYGGSGGYGWIYYKSGSVAADAVWVSGGIGGAGGASGIAYGPYPVGGYPGDGGGVGVDGGFTIATY